MYEMVRYHMGLDGSGSSGKRLRPLLGLLAFASITGTWERALPGAAAVELGHNFSLIHDDIEDGDGERRHRATLWAVHGIPQAINTGDAVFVLSRIALHRLTALGFSDSTVLRLMRLYDDTCLALCEGQYIDIWTSEHDTAMTVDLYFDMIGHTTADDRARLLGFYADPDPTADEIAQAMAIVDRTGAQDYTRGEARRWRDEAIAELDAAGVVQPDAREKLEQIMRSVISA